MRWFIFSVCNAILYLALCIAGIVFVSPWLIIPCSMVMAAMLGSCWMVWDGWKHG